MKLKEIILWYIFNFTASNNRGAEPPIAFRVEGHPKSFLKCHKNLKFSFKFRVFLLNNFQKIIVYLQLFVYLLLLFFVSFVISSPKV
jgi:hypothetical protein